MSEEFEVELEKEWDQEHLIIAALVRRLGGNITLLRTELEPSGGLMICSDRAGDLEITAK